MKYYERIRQLRKEKGLTQREVASIIFVAQRTYSDYETHRSKIPVDYLVQLAEYYDVSVDYIVGASNIRRSFKNVEEL